MEGATVAIDGAMDDPTFLAYVEQFLTPTLRPGDVVVMDHLAAHQIKGVREAIEAAGGDLWSLDRSSLISASPTLRLRGVRGARGSLLLEPPLGLVLPDDCEDLDIGFPDII